MNNVAAMKLYRECRAYRSRMEARLIVIGTKRLNIG